MAEIRNTTFAVFSDIHGGSPVGLIRPIQWQLQSVNVQASKLQKLIWAQFDDALQAVKKKRRRRRLVTVFDGDATEGVHHGSRQTISQYVREHEQIAGDAIDHALSTTKHNPAKGDRFYMVSGTDSHVGESEERIASDLESVPYMVADNDRVTRWCWPILPLEVNGVFGLIAHHGPGAGKGANEGNPLRNAVRNVVVARKMRDKRVPQFIIYGHKHARQHVLYEFEDIRCHGFILPSFQGKSNWFYGVDPFAINNVGMLVIDIDADGRFSWEWLTMELTEHQEKVERL